MAYEGLKTALYTTAQPKYHNMKIGTITRIYQMHSLLYVV
jgi:hypothetical protein